MSAAALCVETTEIDGVRILSPSIHQDNRGYFTEIYNKKTFSSCGIDIDFIQDNQSYSKSRGVIRGIHFQTPPFAQDKLVRVVKGSIFDVAVDLRAGSPTYGKHVSVTLRAGDGRQLLVPIGFGHAFCTLEADTEVIYKVSNYYAPQHDDGIRWDDPSLAIEWPIAAHEALLSPKDRALPTLTGRKPPF